MTNLSHLGQAAWTIQIPPGLMLDESEGQHRYTLAGKPLVGMTRVLEDCGYYPFSSWYTEASRQRGSAVHVARHLVDWHDPEARTVEDIQRVSIDSRLLPYVAGWLQFKREKGFRTILSEQIVASQIYRCAGTCDVVGEMDGRLTVVDLKSWKDARFQVQRAAAIQTGGYAVMLREMGVPIESRWVVQLTGDPRRLYKPYECTNLGDEALAMWCVSLWWDREQHGLLRKFKPPVVQDGDNGEDYA